MNSIAQHQVADMKADYRCTLFDNIQMANNLEYYLSQADRL